MARGLRPLSTDPAADLDILFRRAVYAWPIADGDMHLKNLAMLKTAEAGAKTFTTVRSASLYDAVTTRVFPGLGVDGMALKLNGKDDRPTRQDFLTLARTMGLAVGNAEAAINEIADRLARRVQTLSLPAFAGQSEAARGVQDKVIALIEARRAALGDPVE